jgi:hypothetical protein
LSPQNPIRVATAALSKRIFAGRATKDGLGLKHPRHDVTSDVLLAVRDHVGVGFQVTVEADGVPQFRIAVTDPEEPTVEHGGKTEAVIRRDGFFIVVDWHRHGAHLTARVYEPQGMRLTPALADLLALSLEERPTRVAEEEEKT